MPEAILYGFFMEFENFKVNCSQIGSLMGGGHTFKPPTIPQLNKLYEILGRDYEELTERMKFNAKEVLTKAIYYDPKRPTGKILSEFVLIYAYEVYGKGKVSKGNDSPAEMEKGNLAESDAIAFLSKADGKNYEKNGNLLENQWFKGTPDIIVASEDGEIEKVIDVKVSFDLPSFILTKMRSEHPNNVYELMGYMDLLKCKKGEIVHVLVDMPASMVSRESERLKERYATLGLDEITMSNKLQAVFNNMEYSNVPEEYKLFRRDYTLNRMTMRMVKSRVTKAKKWMKMVHESFTQNNVTLVQIDAEPEEDNV
jgi:hypothetical protein